MHSRLIAGLLFIVVGLVGGFASAQYQLGTLARMGSGYYPLLMSIGLVLVGLAVCLVPDAANTKIDLRGLRIRYGRPWLFVTAGILVFIVTVNWAGFVVASFLSVYLASFADRRNGWRDGALLAAGATVFSVIIFYYGVQIQIPLFVTW